MPPLVVSRQDREALPAYIDERDEVQMLIAVTALSVLAFLAAFRILGLVDHARAAVTTSRRTMQVMGDATLDDDAKEAAVQRAARTLLVAFAGLALRFAAILVAAYVPILLASAAGLVSQSAALAFMMRADVIVVASALVLGAVWLMSRWRR